MEFQAIKAAIETDLSAQSHIRDAYKDDVKFSILGEQWDSEQLAQRKRRKRPALVYNRLPAFIRHVVNGCRQEDRSARSYPIGDGALKATAELIDQRIRAIQIASDAGSARDTALECAVAGGYGWYRIVVDGYGDDKEIRIEGIRDPLAVVWDSSAIRADRSDITHLAYMTTMSRKEFEARYNREPLPYETSGTWTPSDSEVTVCEFWYIEDGKVFQAILDGKGIVEDPEEFPCSMIPFVFVPGEEYFIDGKTYLKGIVRDSKEPQRFLNFWKSEVAEQIQSKKTPPAVVDAQSIVGADGEVYPEWKDPDGNYAYRRVKNPQFPPMFPPPAQIPTGAANEAATSVDDIKAAVGIYDASMGARSNEQSGKAILARQAQGDLATFHFRAALDRAVRIEGLILTELVLALDSQKKWVQLAGEDGQITTQEIGAIMRLRDGTKAEARFEPGRYGIVVTSGPSFSSRRREMADALQTLGSAFPQFGQYGADLLARVLDFPGSEELADRIRLAMEKQGMIERKDDTPEAMREQQVQQLIQAVGQMTQELQTATQDRAALSEEVARLKSGIEEKIAQATIDARTRLEIARIDAETRLAVAQMSAENDRDLAFLSAAQKSSQQSRDQSHDVGMAILNDQLKDTTAVPGQAGMIATDMETAPVLVVENEPEHIALEGVE